MKRFVKNQIQGKCSANITRHRIILPGQQKHRAGLDQERQAKGIQPAQRSLPHRQERFQEISGKMENTCPGVAL